MEDKHGLPEQRFSMERAGAVGGQKVAEIQGERRIANGVTSGVARRKSGVAPALVLGRVEKKEIDAVGRGGAVVDPVGRFSGNGDVTAERGARSVTLFCKKFCSTAVTVATARGVLIAPPPFAI